MNAGGVGPSSETTRVTDGLVEVERETERREVGIVATYTVRTENDRPVAVRVVNDLPKDSTDGTGFHPAHEPRWWTVEDGRLGFKDTVGSAAPATFEFGLAVEGGFDGPVSLPDPEIAHSEPVGVTREGDRVVFPDADGEEDVEAPAPPATSASEAETPRGGLLSGVRSAVFGGEDEEVVRASDLDPDAMVVAREGSAAEDPLEPTQLHAENPTLTPVVVPLTDAEPADTFSALPTDTLAEDVPTDDTPADDAPAAADDAPADDTPTGDAPTEKVDAPPRDEPSESTATDTEVLPALLAELSDDSARERLRAELGLDELERTRTEVQELADEVAALREEVATNADANETTAARLSELCRAVDDLAAEVGRDVAVVPPTDIETDR